MLYKFLDAGRRGPFSGWQWPKIGTWAPPVAKLSVCASGYHLCREQDLIPWLREELYEAEGDGASVESNDKIVFTRARLLRRVETWNRRTMILVAADWAEHVLPIFESKYPKDNRPRLAIEAAKNGDTTAASAIAAAAYAADAAADADAAAAAAATAAAAYAAAASKTERAWQTARLMQYIRGEIA